MAIGYTWPPEVDPRQMKLGEDEPPKKEALKLAEREDLESVSKYGVDLHIRNGYALNHYLTGITTGILPKRDEMVEKGFITITLFQKNNPKIKVRPTMIKLSSNHLQNVIADLITVLIVLKKHDRATAPDIKLLLEDIRTQGIKQVPELEAKIERALEKEYCGKD